MIKKSNVKIYEMVNLFRSRLGGRSDQYCNIDVSCGGDADNTDEVCQASLESSTKRVSMAFRVQRFQASSSDRYLSASISVPCKEKCTKRKQDQSTDLEL
jgi:hypothetical protein